MSKIPVIIDVDGSADNLWGLAAAAAAEEELAVKAVTVCAGKRTPKQAFDNAAFYATAAGLSCPLYKGSERSILLKEKPAWNGDGEDGLAGMVFTEKAAYAEGYAWDVIYREAKKADGELTLICFGPMTNLAIALFKYQDLALFIKKVIFAGGSYDFGNVSSVIEINMATDPEAARAVFRSKIAKTMVGFNTMFSSRMSESQIEEIADRGEAGRLFRTCSDVRREQLDRVCYGAPLAVAALVRPEIMNWVRYHLTIETKSSICRGRTTPLNMYSPRGFEKDTDISMDADMDLYLAFLKAAIDKMNGAR